MLLYPSIIICVLLFAVCFLTFSMLHCRIMSSRFDSIILDLILQVSGGPEVALKLHLQKQNPTAKKAMLLRQVKTRPKKTWHNQKLRVNSQKKTASCSWPWKTSRFLQTNSYPRSKMLKRLERLVFYFIGQIQAIVGGDWERSQPTPEAGRRRKALRNSGFLQRTPRGSWHSGQGCRKCTGGKTKRFFAARVDVTASRCHDDARTAAQGVQQEWTLQNPAEGRRCVWSELSRSLVCAFRRRQAFQYHHERERCRLQASRQNY